MKRAASSRFAATTRNSRRRDSLLEREAQRQRDHEQEQE